MSHGQINTCPATQSNHAKPGLCVCTPQVRLLWPQVEQHEKAAQGWVRKNGMFLKQKTIGACLLSPLVTLVHTRCGLNLKSHFGSIGSPHLFSVEMAPADSIAALVGQWKSNDKLVKQASTGVMAVVGKRSELSRKEVCANYEILIPVVEHLGVPT